MKTGVECEILLITRGYLADFRLLPIGKPSPVTRPAGADAPL